MATKNTIIGKPKKPINASKVMSDKRLGAANWGPEEARRVNALPGKTGPTGVKISIDKKYQAPRPPKATIKSGGISGSTKIVVEKTKNTAKGNNEQMKKAPAKPSVNKSMIAPAKPAKPAKSTTFQGRKITLLPKKVSNSRAKMMGR